MLAFFKAMSALTVIGAVLPASASAQEDFRGATIKVVVSSAAGTSYDSFARVIARHLPRSIAGAPTVIVQNMPGAGGLVAANHLYALAEKDGTVMTLLNRNSLIQPIVGNKQARYKSEQFYWLGTPASYRDEPYLFLVSSKVPHKTAAEIMQKSSSRPHRYKSATPVPS